jgi:gag-polypeptide of LTR copia-type/Zinc knuckle
MANQLKRNGENLTEMRIVEKILRSLTDAFENVVCAIEESKDLNELSVDELTDLLMANEQRKKLKKKESLEEVLQAKVVLEEKTMYVQKGQVCGRGGRSRGQGRGEIGQSSQNSRGRERGRGGRGNKPDVDCYNCGKYEHYARDCWVEKKVEGKTNYAKVKEDGDVLFMAQSMSISGSNIIWYLDTGASNHMIGHKHLFCSDD